MAWHGSSAKSARNRNLKKPSDIERLAADLRSADAVVRDAAVARLRIIGSRAVARLAILIESDADPSTRRAALNALNGIDDRRAIDPAIAALASEQPSVAAAAVDVLRGWVTRESGTRVLDALTTLALDRTRDARVRLAALDALSDLPRDLVQPILEQGPPSMAATLDEPGTTREWVASRGDRAPLSELHDLVARTRERERAEPSAHRRQEWLAVRGAAHAALARRGSRVALYDLRESFDAAAAPLPLDFLTALAAIGDATCLEPTARAWAASPGETWWRERLQSAAEEIVHRTRLSGRSAVMKRLRAKWNGFV